MAATTNGDHLRAEPNQTCLTFYQQDTERAASWDDPCYGDYGVQENARLLRQATFWRAMAYCSFTTEGRAYEQFLRRFLRS